MLAGLTDRVIDRVIQAYRLTEGAKLVPRWCLRWSINLAVLALVEFIIGAVAAFCRGAYVQGAIVASVGGGWLLIYAVFLGLCYLMVYQSQTRLFQNIYKRPFWRPLGVLHRLTPIAFILLAPLWGNLAGIAVAVSCFTESGIQ